MGELYEMSRRITEEIGRDNSPMDQVRLRGELAVKTGFIVTLIAPSDPDDPAKIAALRAAARDVLGLTL